MIHSTTITGLRATIYTDEGAEEVLMQTGAVSVDCWLVGGKVVRVVTPDGITFSGKTGTLTRPDNFDVTELCDQAKRVALAKQIEDERDERLDDRIASRVLDRVMRDLPNFVPY